MAVDPYRVPEPAEVRAERQAALVGAEMEAHEVRRLSAEIARLAMVSDDELLRILDLSLVGLERVPVEQRGESDRTTRLRAVQRLLRWSDEQVEERRTVAIAHAAAVEAAAIAERDRSRPPMRVQFPNLAPAPFIATRDLKLRGGTVARGDTVDVTAFWWPPSRLERLVRNDFLIADPTCLEACAAAVAANGGRLPTAKTETDEDPEARKRRLARERQARRRARAKENTK